MKVEPGMFCLPVIPDLRRPKQDDHMFKDNLSYMLISYPINSKPQASKMAEQTKAPAADPDVLHSIPRRHIQKRRKSTPEVLSSDLLHAHAMMWGVCK